MRSTWRWGIVGVVAGVAAVGAGLGLEWAGWAMAWAGAMFKAASGGALGWAISRHAIGLDLSEVEKTYRARAALSQALLVAGFAIAVALGA